MKTEAQRLRAEAQRIFERAQKFEATYLAPRRQWYHADMMAPKDWQALRVGLHEPANTSLLVHSEGWTARANHRVYACLLAACEWEYL